MEKLRRRLCVVLLFLLLAASGIPAAGAVGSVQTQAAELERRIELLAQALMGKHGVLDRGDYSWLDSTDFDAVGVVNAPYQKFKRTYGAAAVALIRNATELERMNECIAAALAEVDALMQEIAASEQAMGVTIENYRAAYETETAEFRRKVAGMPMPDNIRADMLAKISQMEQRLAGVQRKLAACAAQLNALSVEAIRFDGTEEVYRLLLYYESCSADARTYMACREHAAALSARLIELEQTQKTFEALRIAIPRVAAEGAKLPYARKAELLELAARYDALEPYVREKLDDALAGAKLLFLAARTKLEACTRAVLAVADALGQLPDMESIICLSDEATAACRERALDVQKQYDALCEDAEREEISALAQRLEAALLATTQFTVTADSAHGTVSADSPVYYGKECTVRVQPDAGWRAVRLLNAPGAVRTQEGWRFTVQSDMAVTVEFERMRYPVTVLAACSEGGACTLFGTVSAPEEAEHNGTLLCELRPEPSHKVAAVTARTGEAEAPLETEVRVDGSVRCTLAEIAGPVVLEVQFEPYVFAVTTKCIWKGEAVEYGNISAGASVRWGGAYEGIVSARPGYRIARVLADGAPVTVDVQGRFVVYDIRADVLITAEVEAARLEQRPEGGNAVGGGGGASGDHAWEERAVPAELSPLPEPGDNTADAKPPVVLEPEGARDAAQERDEKRADLSTMEAAPEATGSQIPEAALGPKALLEKTREPEAYERRGGAGPLAPAAGVLALVLGVAAVKKQRE